MSTSILESFSTINIVWFATLFFSLLCVCFDHFCEPSYSIITVLVVDGVECSLVELSVGRPDVFAVGDDFAFIICGDDRFRIVIRVGLILDKPPVGKTFLPKVQSGTIVAIPDFWDFVDRDLSVAV